MSHKQPLLLAIGGATGSGKTNLALQLGKQFRQLVILSADSRQIYKYLNVGSAKIGTAAIDYRLTGRPEPVRQAAGVSQYLIDIAEPNTHYTLAEYQSEADRLIRACWEQNKIPVLVGGTGLYIQAVMEGYVFKGEVNPELRKKLESLPLDQLQKKITNLGIAIPTTDIKNKRRLIRAIERDEETMDAIHLTRRPPTKNSHTFVLTPSWEAQRALAPDMVQERLDLGLVQETKMLLKNGVKQEWLYGMGLSYRLVIDMLDSQFPEEELKDRLTQAFRQLMRRQRTWFNRMPNAKKLTRHDLFEAIQALIPS